MTMVDKIRSALVYDQAEAVRIISEQDDKILELKDEIDQLKHTIKALGFELSARYAANKHLKQIIKDVTSDGEGTDDYD